MRQIEKAMLAAVRERRNWKSGNTRVENFNDEMTIYLHGNAIYRIIDGVHYFTLAGWNTPTTRSRLRTLGVSVRQKDYTPIYKGCAISSTAWITC